jgi:integrase
MASLSKQKKYYYARVSRHRTRQNESWISLRTTSVSEAKRRIREVEIIEEKIKAGEPYGFFSWEYEKQPLRRISILDKAISTYMSECNERGLKPVTLEIYQYALDGLMKITGAAAKVHQITPSMINSYCASVKKTQKPITINKHLRALKSFLIWANDNEIIDKVPRIRMLTVEREKPKYVSEIEFLLIQDYLKDRNPYMAKVFSLYYETGMRLSEPFYGDLPLNQPKAQWYLLIPGSMGKNNGERVIELEPKHWTTIRELRFKNWTPKHYSRCFWKTCKALGIRGKKFHGMRHSYAVREWLLIGDLYKVARSLGHSSIVTTEIYASFHEIQLRSDFPTAWEVYKYRTQNFRQSSIPSYAHETAKLSDSVVNSVVLEKSKA